MTANENWADAIGYRAAIRYARNMQSMDTIRQTITLFTQTWCSPSRPRHYPPTYYDPHSAPFLRVNATIKGTISFYVAFGCEAKPAYIC